MWESMGVPQAARIAFRWAQFPSDQEFEAGDWIMGMAALEHRPDKSFHIRAHYADDNNEHEVVTDAVTCPE